MKKKQEIDSEITPTALEEITAVKEEVVPPAEEAPAKKARRKKTKKEEASPKEESLAPEAPVEEAISAQDEQAAEEQTEESDPYAPYRYRWTVKQKDLVKFSYRHALTAVVAVILALGLVAMGNLGVIRLTDPPTASPQGGDASAGDVVLKPLAPQKPENALSVQEMIAKVKPSVVCIDVVKKD
ncbi:MAG: hypothetical protein IKT43_03830, partial [Clostridia bacterium]|nr:hypothetical protein [Clostridia bacterium]